MGTPGNRGESVKLKGNPHRRRFSAFKWANLAADNGYSDSAVLLDAENARMRRERSRRWWRRLVIGLLVPGLFCPGAGCTRRFYRNKADAEAADLLEHKAADPRWALQDDYHVYP